MTRAPSIPGHPRKDNAHIFRIVTKSQLSISMLFPEVETRHIGGIYKQDLHHRINRKDKSKKTPARVKVVVIENEGHPDEPLSFLVCRA
jgi:hypothetical protein